MERLGFGETNEWDIGEQAGTEGVEAVSKHAEAIKLKLPQIVDFEVLCHALEKNLPTAVPIAAMYQDDEDGNVIVRLCVSDVAFLRQLASAVLTGAPSVSAFHMPLLTDFP